ncbi:DUF11 domain-containing protein [Microbacterium sp. Marseille-Q6965]|uniref:DUF11 domain-containing protein n=1 Tax=Microbacterium sp. Marseille-Q6965 TaxID=2965072 RepID=UPI0021B7E643|nr:DUF11 domain-containing protein [Microbacterium sp. Marseille-Q6965]
MRKATRKKAIAGAAVSALVAGMLAAGAVVGVAPASAAPGNPGVPSDPAVLFAEDFQLFSGTTPVGLADYVGQGGQRYTADAAWLQNCNGQIVTFNIPYTSQGNCAQAVSSANLRQLTYALGVHSGAANPNANAAVAAYTEGNPGANAIEFATVNPIPLASASGRFLTFSVDTAAKNCQVSPPLYQFSFVSEAGAATPVGGQLNACTSGETVPAPQVGTVAATDVSVGTYTSNGSVLFNGQSLGIRMANANGSGAGNDAAFDNIRVLDVTPQLDKSFSPASVAPGQASTLTFTVTNTSELAAKNGWSFTDALPAGLEVADPAATATTCPAGTVTATPGATSITAGGNLTAGMESCTVTVNVVGFTAGSFTNGPDNITPVGLNEPGEATLTVVPPVVTCTSDPNIFNTGFNAATGGVLPDNAKDPNWQVAGPFPAGATVAAPPADADWGAANVGKIVANWADSPYNNAQWISQQTIAAPNQGVVSGDWYYRFQFELDDAVDPASFELAMNFLADNSVAEVFVNGEPQSGKTTGLPQTPLTPPSTNPGAYNYAGFFTQNAAETTLDSDWRTGLNTIAVQIKSNAPMEGFDAQMRPSALCPQPDLAITKTSNASAETRAGDTVTYTVTAENIGTGDFTAEEPAVVTDDLTGVLDDATYNGDAEADRDGDVAFADPRLTWSGALPVGETVTLTYSVEVTGAGDGVARNVAFAGDGDSPACDPPTEEGTDPITGVPCATTEQELPRLSVEKTADRTELPAVGESVTYTVVVTNDGPGDYTSANPATATDDLAEVLDDATLDEDSITASTGEATFADGRITWTGALAAEQSATITYTVAYTGAGDNVLLNRACVPTDQATPGALPCDTVRIPAANLQYWKTVDPASGAAVRAGQELTYTLSFRNDGQATADVDATDDLSAVLDDAEIIAGPTASDAALAAVVTGETLTVTGTLAPGATTTVTYTVRVLGFDEQGDGVLRNALTDPNGSCLLDECTTENPVAHLSVDKTSDAVDGVSAGDTVTYTVTVTNDGEGDYTAQAPAAISDDMTDVLDDAAYNGDVAAVASDGTNVPVPTFEGTTLSWSGPLAAGETVTITYSVTVTNLGDHDLINTAAVVCGAGEICDPPTPPVEILLPHVVPSKTSDPASGEDVVAGDVITYTLSWTNDGKAAGPLDSTDDLSDVLDDADLNGPPVVDAAHAGSVSATFQAQWQVIRVTGDLAVGDTVTVTYEVTVREDGQRGNNILANVNEPDVPPYVPDPDCDPADCPPFVPPATEHRVPEIVDSKTVDPASNTSVRAGQELTYTLTFTNEGTAAGTVDRVDDLTHVLDDAEVTAAPVASDDALSVSEITDARFAVTGVLAPGATVTVAYTVTVKAADQLGDAQLANFLLDPGTPPPAEPVCGDGQDCTFNPISDVTVVKTADPEDGAEVQQGQKVTYTLTFANTGRGGEAIDYTDHMGGVLDDADLTAAPAASNGALSVSPVSDGAFSVAGELAAGQTVTVVYTVTVRGWADQGDHALGNVVTVSGQEPPTACADDSDLCTIHPIAEPAAPPLAATGGAIAAGVAGGALLLLLAGGVLLIARRRASQEITEQ